MMDCWVKLSAAERLVIAAAGLFKHIHCNRDIPSDIEKRGVLCNKLVHTNRHKQIILLSHPKSPPSELPSCADFFKIARLPCPK